MDPPELKDQRENQQSAAGDYARRILAVARRARMAIFYAIKHEAYTVSSYPQRPTYGELERRPAGRRSLSRAVPTSSCACGLRLDAPSAARALMPLAGSGAGYLRIRKRFPQILHR